MKRLLLLFTLAGLTAQITPKKGLLTDITPKKYALHQTDPILYKKKTIEILDWRKTIETLPLELQDEVALLAILDKLREVENSFLPQEQIKSIILLTFEFIKQHINEINWQALIDILFTSDFIYKVPFDQKQFYNRLALLAKKQADPEYKKIYEYFKTKIDHAEALTRQIRVLYGSTSTTTTPAEMIDLMRQGAFVLVPYCQGGSDYSFLSNYIPSDEEYLTELTKLNLSKQEIQRIFAHIIDSHSGSISHQIIDLYLKRGAQLTEGKFLNVISRNEMDTLKTILKTNPDKRMVSELLHGLIKQHPDWYANTYNPDIQPPILNRSLELLQQYLDKKD